PRERAPAPVAARRERRELLGRPALGDVRVPIEPRLVAAERGGEAGDGAGAVLGERALDVRDGPAHLVEGAHAGGGSFVRERAQALVVRAERDGEARAPALPRTAVRRAVALLRG